MEIKLIYDNAMVVMLLPVSLFYSPVNLTSQTGAPRNYRTSFGEIYFFAKAVHLNTITSAICLSCVEFVFCDNDNL
jgi:hypothetical protein